MRKCVCEAASLREGSHGREGLMGMRVGREVMTNICYDRQEEGREKDGEQAKCKRWRTLITFEVEGKSHFLV